MRIALSSVIAAIIVIPTFGLAQVKPGTILKVKLAPEVKYVDANNNDSIVVEEAIAVFEQYLTNPSRNMKNELIEDVESVLIDLISYLETINCTVMKRTPAAKRFIELYYVNKLRSGSKS
jgi:hypothetical protein